MQSRWVLSEFYTSASGQLLPVAADYGSNWMCPTFPSTITGTALVLVNIDPHQVAAAAADTRLLVCPLVFDPSPVAPAVITAYASMGATTGMSIGALLARLAAVEPIFGTQTL